MCYLIMKPSSFSTICTLKCIDELIGLLLSLSLHHPDESIYIMADSATKDTIDNLIPKPKLNIIWKISLDKYSHFNRSQMEQNNLWNEFQLKKSEIITYALECGEKDVLFLDSDIIVLSEINDIDNTKEIGVSPHYCDKHTTDKVGYYNGGTLWTRTKDLEKYWRLYTKTSRYCEQAPIEDLAKKFSHFEFGENYNFAWWRVHLVSEIEKNKNIKNVTTRNKKIYYKGNELKYIHTHFHQQRFSLFNNMIISILNKAKRYKELLIIYRVINKCWKIKIPKQPIGGIWNHANDSFRELAFLFNEKNKGVNIDIVDNIGNCSIEPNILLYDRPTLLWENDETSNCSLFLLGNGDIETEGKLLQSKGLTVKPWIFWPRNPRKLEKLLEIGILNYEERCSTTIFIGNYENNTQKKYRKTNHNWKSVVDEFHCTSGTTHKFSQEEYLMKLRGSKYGLCLRGFGSKCHREVELMAFGTVPIVTPTVSINSYMNPLVENVHYLKASNPEELKARVANTSKEQWEQMSKACYEWYQRNVHSDNCWDNTITNVLY